MSWSSYPIFYVIHAQLWRSNKWKHGTIKVTLKMKCGYHENINMNIQPIFLKMKAINFLDFQFAAFLIHIFASVFLACPSVWSVCLSHFSCTIISWAQVGMIQGAISWGIWWKFIWLVWILFIENQLKGLNRQKLYDVLSSSFCPWAMCPRWNFPKQKKQI